MSRSAEFAPGIVSKAVGIVFVDEKSACKGDVWIVIAIVFVATVAARPCVVSRRSLPATGRFRLPDHRRRVSVTPTTAKKV